MCFIFLGGAFINKAAGIVLYESNITRLRLLLKSLLPQSEIVFIVDNSNNELDFSNFPEINIEKIVYYKNETNLGLAKSLSILCSIARNSNFAWLLLLDQDSIVSDGIFDNYNRLIDRDEIALMCPTVIEDRFGLVQTHRIINSYSYPNTFEVESAITSGSYINLNIQEHVSFFEDLFVDGVDNDYSYRLRNLGFKLVYVADNFIYHEFGDSELTLLSYIYQRLFGEIHPALLRRNHSPLRIYYQVKNTVIIYRKWYGHPNEFIKGSLVRVLFSFTLKVLLVEKNKLYKLLKIISGVIEGFKYEFVGENE
jgi:rhamnosyltransferase